MTGCCARCRSTLGGLKSLACSGFCCRKFHASCVGITDDAFKIIDDSLNITWRCDICANLPSQDLLLKLSDVSKDLVAFLNAINVSEMKAVDVKSYNIAGKSDKNHSSADKKNANNKSSSIGDKEAVFSGGAVTRRQLRSTSSLAKKNDVKNSITVSNLPVPSTPMCSGINLLSVAKTVASSADVVVVGDDAAAAAADSAIVPKSASPAGSASVVDGDVVAAASASAGGIDMEIIDRANDNNNWITVKHKRHSKFKIIGTSSSAGLAAINKLKWLHLSRLDPKSSEEDVINFISSKFNVDACNLICKRLTKADVDVSGLKFVTFKLGIPEFIISYLLRDDVWPQGVVIREFINYPKNDNVQMPVARIT